MVYKGVSNILSLLASRILNSKGVRKCSHTNQRRCLLNKATNSIELHVSSYSPHKDCIAKPNRDSSCCTTYTNATAVIIFRSRVCWFPDPSMSSRPVLNLRSCAVGRDPDYLCDPIRLPLRMRLFIMERRPTDDNARELIGSPKFVRRR